MAGIKSIVQNRKQDYQTGGLELWLKDGDQAHVAVIATGEENDARLDDFYRHTVQIRSTGDDAQVSWNNVLCDARNGKKCTLCDSGNKPQHRFGVWTYVYRIVHSENRDNAWKATKLKTGNVVYVEDVNDFRVFSQGFGQKDYIWNAFVDIYTEYGALNMNVVRIKRSGSGMKDTSYLIRPTADAVHLPNDVTKRAAELVPIVQFFSQSQESNQPVKIEDDHGDPFVDGQPSQTVNVNAENDTDDNDKLDELF